MHNIGHGNVFCEKTDDAQFFFGEMTNSEDTWFSLDLNKIYRMVLSLFAVVKPFSLGETIFSFTILHNMGPLNYVCLA